MKNLKELDIKLSSTHLTVNFDKDFPHDLWEITLTYKGKSFVTTYKTSVFSRLKSPKLVGLKKKMGTGGPIYWMSGSSNCNTIEAIKKGWLNKLVKPDLENVLTCLLCDLFAGEQFYEEWCADCGWNSDSRINLETYLRCQKNAIGMYDLFGREVIKELQNVIFS